MQPLLISQLACLSLTTQSLQTHGIQEERSRGSQSLYICYLIKNCFGALSTRPCPYVRLKKNQIVPLNSYILVLQELSDEEKACDYINASDIVDKEHIEENYLSNLENEVSDLQDIKDLSDDDSDADESNYFMKTIYRTKTVIGKKNQGSFGNSQMKEKNHR
ncbi:hypothetical protein AVEN_69114-1 [Araneus ventricosus]|uniref:Uncharacterized protein n=1 Tax=Araneus ventricosus TaxID=182803 RepID=A0A4Y2I0Y7_ARAVE|nr:hypothetical protein AVEN_69114-1 [Araneus ventricosus]